MFSLHSDFQLLLSEVDLENSKGTEWTPVYSDAKMMAGRTRVKFDHQLPWDLERKDAFSVIRIKEIFFYFEGGIEREGETIF